MTNHTPGTEATFYIARRDTRWDVYPQREPAEVVAHDWFGFYAMTKEGQWFKSPASYVYQREITKEEAESAEFRAGVARG